MTIRNPGCKLNKKIVRRVIMSEVLQRKVLSEQIKEQIMESILKGEFKVGDRLIESVLAKKYGVSHAPIREALKGLQALGFVSVEPYKGTTVKQSGQESMNEYFAVRTVLEGFAGRLAAENITEEELNKLESLLEEMIDAAEKQDFERRGELNRMFHCTLIQASRNTLLTNIYDMVYVGSWSRFSSKYTKMDPNRIARRHRKLIELLRNRDADGVEKALHEHIKESYDSFNSEFLSDNQKTEMDNK